MRTASQKKARQTYMTKVKRIEIAFYPTEADLLAHLEAQKVKAAYIKDLIRADMKKTEE